MGEGGDIMRKLHVKKMGAMIESVVVTLDRRRVLLEDWWE